MKELPTDYLRFAAAARLEAAGEGLENVRQKHLHSAAMWEGLARTADKIEAIRAKRLIEQSAELLETSQ